MQVTTEDAHITHAVMGGMDVIECGITGDAHFMHMMSATLYRDQKQAMVREVLCNAWDAHIMVDKLSPIEIEIDEEGYLIIRDFGPGIHHDMIGPIYGVYGASTKKNDGRQTGGFGLGCKSPWSYTDTFEVTSCHMGKKAIYQMTKSSAERGGKPGIKPIVTNIPTTDTGITVKIRLKQGDQGTITRLIQKVLKYGGIPAMFNGKAFGYIDYSAAKNNWLIVNGEESLGVSGGIFIRYGNVIYPLVSHEQYRDKLREMERVINALPDNSAGYVTLLTAPPDSLTPTPSREELSLTELSLNTIDGLITDFLASVRMDGTKLARELGLERIALAPMKALYNTEHKLPAISQEKDLYVREHNYYRDRYALKRPITTAEDIVEASVAHQYPAKVVRGFRRDDVNARVERLLPTWNKRLADMYKRERRRMVLKNGKNQMGKWLFRNLMGFIAKKMLKDEGPLKMSNMYIWGKPNIDRYWHRDEDGACNLDSQLVEWNQSGINRLGLDEITLAPFMRGRVIVTYARGTLSDRMSNHPTYGYQKAEAEELRRGFIVYNSPRSAKHRDAAIAFFQSLGLEVLDVSDHQESWEGPKPAPVVREKTEPKPKRPKLKGWVRLDACMRGTAKLVYDPYEARDDIEAARIEQPLFYVTLKPKGRDGYDKSLGNFTNDSASKLAVQLYGQFGAIVQKQADIDKLQEAGVPSITDWVVPRLIKEMSTNKRIRSALGNSWGFAGVELHPFNWLYDLAKRVPELQARYHWVDERTPRDMLLQSLWADVQNRTGYYEYAKQWSKEIVQIKELLARTPASRSLALMSSDVKDNLAMEILNGDVMSRYLKSDSLEDAPKRAKLLSLLLDALEG